MPSLLNSYLSLFSTPLVQPSPHKPAPLELRSYPTFHPSLETYRSNPTSALQTPEGLAQGVSMSLPKGKGRRGTLSFLTLPPNSISTSSTPNSAVSSPNTSRLDLSLNGMSPAPSSMYSNASSTSSSLTKREKKLMYNLHTPVAAHNLSFEDWSRFKKLNGSEAARLEVGGGAGSDGASGVSRL